MRYHRNFFALKKCESWVECVSGTTYLKVELCRETGRRTPPVGGEMLAGQVMIPSLRKRWENMCDESRAVLEFAFTDCIKNPILVAQFDSWIIYVQHWEIEIIRWTIGYATFMIALVEGCPAILCDM